MLGIIEKSMRLTQSQIDAILATVRSETESTARAILFGSRLNDSMRGGDIDLLVESQRELLPIQRAKIKMELEALLGICVDIIALTRGTPPTAFQRIAIARGVAL